MAAGPLSTKEYDRLIAVSYEKNPANGKLTQCEITLSSDTNYRTYISSKSQKLFLSVPLDGRIFQLDENFNSNGKDEKVWNQESSGEASANARTSFHGTVEDNGVNVLASESMVKESEPDNKNSASSSAINNEEFIATQLKLEEILKEKEQLLSDIEVLKASENKLLVENKS